MFLRGRILALPKRGNTADEFEDAYAPAEVSEAIELPFTCAVADGATESSFSSVWTQLLVAEFVSCKGDVGAMETQMSKLRAQWRERVSGKQLPWYAEQKLEQGAYATLLGLAVEAGDDESTAKWHAFAVGDSCLFHAKTDGRIDSFPAERAEQLRMWPHLIPSHSREDELLHMIGRPRRGTIEVGDKLVLVTDAIAGWILMLLEEGGAPLEQLCNATHSAEEFRAWIEGLRDGGRIKNDDCTILWLEGCKGAA